MWYCTALLHRHGQRSYGYTVRYYDALSPQLLRESGFNEYGEPLMQPSTPSPGGRLGSFSAGDGSKARQANGMPPLADSIHHSSSMDSRTQPKRKPRRRTLAITLHNEREAPQLFEPVCLCLITLHPFPEFFKRLAAHAMYLRSDLYKLQRFLV